VLAIPLMLRPQADKELARRAVRIARPRHTDHAARKWARAEFGGHLRLILFSCSPHRAVSATASLRVAALDDAVSYDTVKSEAVVEFLADQLLEILDVERRDVGVERDLEAAVIGLEHRDLVVVHGRSRHLRRGHR